VESPQIPRMTPIKSIEAHPTADLALLTLDMTEGTGLRPLWGLTTHDGRFNFAFGLDFQAFGYPVGTFGPEADMPTARLFKGHVQRYVDYVAPGGRYKYLAAELSIPAPVGLSGGPIFSDQGPYAYGLVTTNLESYTTLDEVEEILLDGQPVETQRLRKVISYGLALMFGSRDIAEWLNDRIRPHPVHKETRGWL
jgi:hypothetical protein